MTETPSSKELINWLKERNNKLIFFIILIILISIIIIYYFSFFKDSFWVLTKNIGRPLTLRFITIFIGSLFLTFPIFFLVKIISSKIRKNLTWWFCLTIYLMIFVIIFGFFSIDSYVGTSGEVVFNLFDKDNLWGGTIKCIGQQGPILVHESITCTTNLYEKDNFNPSNEIIITRLFLENGTILEKRNPFLAVENVTYLSFLIFEEYINGSEKKFTTSYTYSFPDESTFKKNREKFLNLSIALIAAVFISIPIMMINLRNLFKGI